MTDGLADLEVVVAFRHDERDRLAGSLQGGGEISRLTLELWRLQRAVSQNDGRVDSVEVAHGRQLLLHPVGELDVATTDRKPHWLEVVHPAAHHGTLDDVTRQTLLLPFGDHQTTVQVAAR